MLKSRREATLAAVLHWIPSNNAYRGLPVVLMAGSAHGDYRKAWIDSLETARVIGHTCTALTVAECPDSASAVYVGFTQPDLAPDRSADVTLTVVLLNPHACSHGETPFTEVNGRLHIPWPSRQISEFVWAQDKLVMAHC
ncbi:MAG: hypothetical protein ABI836_00145 [Gemmatimonadota bacterium]